MTRISSGALAVLLLAAAVGRVSAACVNAKCTDSAAIEKAREMIQSTCGCTRGGQTHGTYKKCVKSTLKLANLTAIIPQKPCRRLIMKCENASICGNLNAAVCCVLKNSGKVKASIVKSATKCKKGTACGASLGFFSTFDACAANGTCAGPKTTTTTSPPTTLATTTTTSSTTTTTTGATTTTSSTTTTTTGATTTTSSTTTITTSTTTTTLCPAANFTFGTTSTGGGPFTQSMWQDGSQTQGTTGCTVTVRAPSGAITLIGTLGDSWSVTGFTGFSNCFLSGACNANGGTCTDCTGVDAPSSCPPAGIANCTSNRPSCSSGLNGNATASAHVQCVAGGPTTTTTTTTSTTTTTICAPQTFNFTAQSTGGGVFSTSSWPGGTVTQGTAPCQVTVQRPSGQVTLVGTLGDSWSVTGFTGFSSCALTGACNANGGTCTSCTGVDAPSSCPPLGIPNCTSNRPSCSTGLNGNATGAAHVQCFS